VEWFNRYVKSRKACALEAPRVLHPVGMNVSVYVGFKVIDDAVREFFIHAPATRPFIREDFVSLCNVVSHNGLYGGLGAVFYHSGTNRAAALKHSNHDGLSASIAPVLLVTHLAVLARFRALPPMKASSTWTSPPFPPSLLNVLLCIARRIR
jgi:hypothetical protein